VAELGEFGLGGLRDIHRQPELVPGRLLVGQLRAPAQGGPRLRHDLLYHPAARVVAVNPKPGGLALDGAFGVVVKTSFPGCRFGHFRPDEILVVAVAYSRHADRRVDGGADNLVIHGASPLPLSTKTLASGEGSDPANDHFGGSVPAGAEPPMILDETA